MRTALAVALVAILALIAHACPAQARPSDCGGLTSVDCGSGADGSAGNFHGMVAASNAGWVLSLAARSGTSPGCGDCVWRVALACPTSNPNDPTSCVGEADPLVCPTGALLYRLYLSDAAVTDEVVGELCLGGSSRLIGIGDQALADVARYLGTATPPRLTMTVRPRGLTLAGLLTELRLSAPPSLGPTEFGGPEVTESITLHVASIQCSWGDGTSTGWQSDSPQITHRYLRAGTDQIGLTVRWAATYTVGYAGQTFGPYDATGQLTAGEVRRERVGTSRPVLVSR